MVEQGSFVHSSEQPPPAGASAALWRRCLFRGQGLSACRHRLLRQAAVAAAAAVLPPWVDVGTAASLSSSLLAELCQGLLSLIIESPSQALADLPAFLARSGIQRIVLGGEGPPASALADRVLRRCSTLTSLDCILECYPAFWPPNLTVLFLKQTWGGDEVADVVAMQHVQLLRLQDAAKLEQLSICTGTVCDWPAALVDSLPGSLQTVRACIDVHADSQELGPSGAFDLSAFHQAAGCTPELHIKVRGLETPQVTPSCAAGMLAGISAAGAFHTLSLGTDMDFVSAHLAELSQLRCSRCILQLDCWEDVAVLPALRHVTLSTEEWGRTFDVEAVGPMSCAWDVLASPGVRCLGTPAWRVPTLDVRGCSGLPAHGRPWALAVWTDDMSSVTGLPASCFVEEARGLHVWRNAAGADLVV